MHKKSLCICIWVSLYCIFFHLVHKKCILHRFILLTCELLKFTLVPNIKTNAYWILKWLGGIDTERWRFFSFLKNSRCVFFTVDTITNLSFPFKKHANLVRYLPVLLNQWFCNVFLMTKMSSGVSLSIKSRRNDEKSNASYLQGPKQTFCLIND